MVFFVWCVVDYSVITCVVFVLLISVGLSCFFRLCYVFCWFFDDCSRSGVHLLGFGDLGLYFSLSFSG